MSLVPARTTATTSSRRTVIPALLVTATVIGLLCLIVTAATARMPEVSTRPGSLRHGTPHPDESRPEPPDRTGVVGRADGRIGDRVVTIFDTDEPAVSGLVPALSEAMRASTLAAERDGVALQITSGWRSRAYQQRLLDRAVTEYGGMVEARRWVNTPDQSTYVTGHAVDVGPPAAAEWLGEHGSAHGLCRVEANESWHVELLTPPGGSCPAERADGAS